MKKNTYLSGTMLIVTLFSSMTALSQPIGTIRGVVVDAASSQPLPYAAAAVREAMVSSAGETVLEIYLTDSVQTRNEIVVRPNAKKDKPLNSMALAGSRQLNIEEADRLLAGELDYTVRLVTAFAGAVGFLSHRNILDVKGARVLPDVNCKISS
jgi:hypothetical protein